MSNISKKPKVLIAALDWGLGHATRLVPVVNDFLKRDWEVFLASSGNALTFLQKSFPIIPSFSLPSYNIHYTHPSMLINMLVQWPNIKQSIRSEKQVVDHLVNLLKPDLIISDNRYGVYNQAIPSIFITHQLQIQPPKWLWFTQLFLKWEHQRQLRHFQQLWIPDFNTEKALSGQLSQTDFGKMPLFYLGPLSRFSKQKVCKNKKAVSEFPRILAMVSGPEPARSHFEKILIDALSTYPHSSVLLRGVIDNQYSNNIKQLQIFSHLEDDALWAEMEKADLVICRSGYSSLMDLYFSGKMAVLVPTPGQTEQLYLAKRLSRQKRFLSMQQKDFKLDKVLKLYSNYSGFERTEAIYESKISEALAQIMI
jgi:uncharacterized protein (TIGR00661 family)